MVELLSPAGNFISLRAVLENGADATYFGLDDFNMRANAKNFSLNDLSEVSKIAKQYSAKTYLCSNVILNEDRAVELKNNLEEIAASEIDGIIYPSVRLKEEGIGVNVAIRPEVIDDAFELKACSVCRYFKRNKKQQLILNYKHSRFRQNGKIYYVIDREFYRDLDFKNTEYDFKTLQFKY